MLHTVQYNTKQYKTIFSCMPFEQEQQQLTLTFFDCISFPSLGEMAGN